MNSPRPEHIDSFTPLQDVMRAMLEDLHEIDATLDNLEARLSSLEGHDPGDE